jgi:lysophospholipase L1-like esterase
LIGVNNQYQGKPIKDFEPVFLSILKSAIELTGNKPKRVFVISIPDWGITPFASGRDKKEIAKEIDAYNLICEKNAKAQGTNFINITDAYRLDGFKTEYLAFDGLHPSRLEYTKWAIKLSQQIKNVFESGG